jgi:2-oxoglutarate ferredoxin oxidoreductase subunit alpha
MSEKKAVLLQGNEACVLGASKRDALLWRYPITPSSEIAEQSSILLPKLAEVHSDGSEFASLARSSALPSRRKGHAATSGPGFRLSRLIGYAAITDVHKSSSCPSCAAVPRRAAYPSARATFAGQMGKLATIPLSVSVRRSQRDYELTIVP